MALPVAGASPGPGLILPRRPAALRPFRIARGFSFIELVVVLVLVALIFSIVAISVSRSISAAEMRNAAQEVTAGLRHTRGRAVTQRSQQVFMVDAEQRTWTAAGRDAVELPDGLEIDLTTARSEFTGENVAGIRFFPDGASTGGSIKLIAGQREWKIDVAWLTGEVSLDRGDEQ